MTRAIPVGHYYDVVPIPPVPEATTYLDVGALSVGVEYRLLTDELVDGAIDAERREAAGIEHDRPKQGLDDQGWSLHICDAETGKEYLRFDGFEGDPHYHYIVPGEYNVVVPFDDVAHGPFRPWAFGCLRDRLPAMLREAGAKELADRVDQDTINAALPTIEDAVDDAIERSNK
jgi:hypothetical protein